MKDISITALLQPMREFMRRFHSILFFVALSGLVIAAGLVILSIISDSKKSVTSSSAINGSFDKATIKKVEELGPSTITTPSGRTNPFVE